MAEVQALLDNHFAGGKHTAADVVAKAQRARKNQYRHEGLCSWARVTIRGLSNKLTVCCASHPSLSEQGHILSHARFSEALTCAGSKRESRQ